MTTYAILTLDVWGNADDGFEVNQKYNSGVTIEISESDTEETIFKKLESLDVGQFPLEQFEISEDTYDICIDWKKDGKPEIELSPDI